MTAEQKQKSGGSNMNISQEGLSLIKKFEGCKLESYKCAAGVWTIGFGSTSGVEEGMEISQERADMLLLEDVKVFEEAVNNLVEVDLEQNQFDALVAWCFNIGPTNAKSSSAIRLLNESKYDEVPASMRLWNKITVDGQKQVSQGLVRRREAESLLFTGEDWSKV